MQTQQHIAPMRALLTKYFLAKVFIRGYQNSIFTERLFNDSVIIHATRFIENGKDIVTLCTQPTR